MAINYQYCKSRREIDEVTRELRRAGYNIIAYGNSLRELERGGEIIVIEIKRR